MSNNFIISPLSLQGGNLHEHLRSLAGRNLGHTMPSAGATAEGLHAPIRNFLQGWGSDSAPHMALYVRRSRPSDGFMTTYGSSSGLHNEDGFVHGRVPQLDGVPGFFWLLAPTGSSASIDFNGQGSSLFGLGGAQAIAVDESALVESPTVGGPATTFAEAGVGVHINRGLSYEDGMPPRLLSYIEGYANIAPTHSEPNLDGHYRPFMFDINVHPELQGYGALEEVPLVNLTTGTDATVSLEEAIWLTMGAPTHQTFTDAARDRRARAMRRRLREQAREAQEAETRERRAREAEAQTRLSAHLQRLSGGVGLTGRELIPTLPFMPHGFASSRRWGIEIESGGARGVEAPEAWERKYDGSLRSAYDGYIERQDFEPYDEERTTMIRWESCEHAEEHIAQGSRFDPERQEYIPTLNPNFRPAQDCLECGSVTRTVRVEPQEIHHEAQSDDCGEFVSPILVSMHSNGLESLLGELSTRPQNSTAGVHVHVESHDLTPTEINALIFGYGVVEQMITPSYRREVRNYCRPISVEQMTLAARQSRSASRGHSSGETYEEGNRYSSVNLHALEAHGTVEFRSMGPVYEYEYLIRWAMFCREMVNIVKAGATVAEFSQISGWEDVLALFATYGKEYARAAAYETSGETGYWAALEKRPEAERLDPQERLNAQDQDVLAWAEELRGERYRRARERFAAHVVPLVGVEPTLASV